jgi:large subunit ribosomal protein L17
LRNLVTSILMHERVTTTVTRAKEARIYTERMITLAKRGDLHARRQAASYLLDESVLKKLFDTIGPRYADRPGGYTRIMRTGPRQGDGAPMAIIELV